MSKFTYVPTRNTKGFSKDYVTVCPFKVRDLSTDVCYSGNGVNKCKFFVRYEWCTEHDGTIKCSCNLPKRVQVGVIAIDKMKEALRKVEMPNFGCQMTMFEIEGFL